MYYILILIGCLGFAASSIGIHIYDIQQLDTSTVIWMSQHRSPIFNEIAVFLSNVGGLGAMLGLVGIWTLIQICKKKYESALFTFLSFCSVAGIGWVLKFLFDRTRPDSTLGLVETYGASFPSAHSIYAAALGCLILMYFQHHRFKRIIYFFVVIWVVGMGFSRVYVAAHFPTDVIAGWSIAFIWYAFLWLVFFKRLKHKKLFLVK